MALSSEAPNVSLLRYAGWREDMSWQWLKEVICGLFYLLSTDDYLYSDNKDDRINRESLRERLKRAPEQRGIGHQAPIRHRASPAVSRSAPDNAIHQVIEAARRVVGPARVDR